MSEGTSEFICMAGLGADWKAAAGEANVNARGSVVGEALRARVLQEMKEASRQSYFHLGLDELKESERHTTRYWAFNKVLQWLDEAEANAASTWQAARMATS